MQLITQGKTNWKFLSIIFILVVVAGGGIAFLTFYPIEIIERPTPPLLKCEKNPDCVNTCCGCINDKKKCGRECEVLPERKCICVNGKCDQKQDETADWQTYTNEEYGFEIKYPQSLITKDWASETPNWDLLIYVGDNKFFGDGKISIGIEKGISTLNQKIENSRLGPVGIPTEDLKETSIGQNNYMAKKWSYEGEALIPELEGDKENFIEYFVEHGGHLYQIHYDKLYIGDISEETFNQMLSTFTLY